MNDKHMKIINRFDLSTFILVGIILLVWGIPKINFDLRASLLNAMGIVLTIIMALFVLSITNKRIRESISSFIKQGKSHYEEKIRKKSEELIGSKVKSEVYSELSRIAREQEIFERIKNVKKYFGLSFIFLMVLLILMILLPNEISKSITNNQIFFISFWASLYPLTQLIMAFWLAYPND